jgi:lipopolysaccharide transport system permease protein
MQEIVKIKQSGRWVNFDLIDLWNYRELLYFLILRDIKIRYKQTFFGVAWAILQPVLTTAISTLIFTQFVRFESENIPYPVYALSGWLIWLFFNSSINNSGNSLINNTNLVTKVYFPRLITPIATVFAVLIDLLIGFVLLILMMFYYGISLSWKIVFVLIFMLLLIVLTSSFGIAFSALNVRFRDVKYALPFALQMLMFATPIFYSTKILSEKWQFILSFNPLTGILEGFRSSLFGDDFNWQTITFSVGFTVILFFVSLYIFKQMEDAFADLI